MSTFSNLLFHIVYSTKYRKPTIAPNWEDELYGYIGGIIRERQGVLLRINGMPDHVHILAKLNPSIAISDVVRDVKANSSRWINERSDVVLPFEWQKGYAVFSVSESQVDAVRNYIANQKTHHEKKTFEDEFLALLKRHNIPFDLKYVFEHDVTP